MSARTAAVALLSALVLLACAAPPARSEFGPIQLVSGGAGQPAAEAGAPALSANGRYLAFAGTIGRQTGVFRRDLQTGSLEAVAVVDATEPEASAFAAESPSISADGRYVSFTTRARLDPANDQAPNSRDVYVADMSTSPPTFELASALDGCDPMAETGCGLAYANGEGSRASGRVALSADGREVVFYTAGESDLTSGPEGSTPGEPTPRGQVVIRDLAADTTTLVSAERDPLGGMTERPVAGGSVLFLPSLPGLRGAAISADGTTVAWIATHLPAQVPLPQGEAEKFNELDGGLRPYDEPLWRRIGDGPSAPIRRVVGGAGAPFSDLAEKNPELNTAQGWLGVGVNGGGAVDGVPSLSADGSEVALIGNPTEATNVFLVDMAPGLDRSEAVCQLTRETVIDPTNPVGTINAPGHVALTGHVFDLALSGDGEKVAFTTARQSFPLAPPNLIDPPPTSVGLVELYLIDLEAGALRRVTHGLGGITEPSIDAAAVSNGEQAAIEGDGAASPALGGNRIAFASTAYNLVAEDSNEASDVFLDEDHAEPPRPGAATITPGPALKVRPAPWRLTLAAFSLPDGGVRIVAGVPAAGALRAKAGSEPDEEARARRLALAGARAARPGRVAIELRLPPRLQRLARTREGVYALARVSFHHPGRRTLRGRVQVRFHVHAKQGRRR